MQTRAEPVNYGNRRRAGPKTIVRTIAFLLGSASSPALAAGQAAPLTQVQAQQMLERMDQLERKVAQLQDELARSRPQNGVEAGAAPKTAVAEQTSPTGTSPLTSRGGAVIPSRDPAATEPARETLPPVQAASASGSTLRDGFRVGASTITLTGFVKLQASESKFSRGSPANGSFGRDFYFNQQIPVTGRSQGALFDASAKQTRLAFATSTPFKGHDITTLVEADFQSAPGAQGTQRTTNGYDFALRRAYVTYGGLLAGQDWTTFQYVPAAPESTDFNGTLDATVFVRQPMVRYTRKLSPNLEVAVSLENAETVSATRTSGALIENGADRVPDLSGRLRYKTGRAELQLAGLLRHLSLDNGAYGADATGWGASVAGLVPYGANKWNDLRFMATYGSGIGRYVGVNYAPDVIYGGSAADRLQKVDVAAAFVALRHGWTDRLRSSLILTYQHDDYPANALAIDLNKRAWSGAVNLFYSPAPRLDFGIEYRHASREVLTGDEGTLNRTEFAAKLTF